MTLEQFCEEHDLAYPQDNREFVLRPASLDEVGLFYSEEKLDEALGTVGHLRMDFGHGEKEFWHTWWPHNEDRFNTPEFKEVLQRFVDDLRQTGLLKNLGAMDAYCWQHGGSITEDRRSYGYIAETENYRFCLRCTPFPGEYQGYLYCYDLCQQEMYRQEHPVVGRVTFASGEQQEFTDSKALLQAIREELPFRSTTGFRFETLTDDPEVKKAVDDILLDFAGEDNSRRTCNYGLTETGKQALTLVSSMHRNREPLLHCAVFLELTAPDYDALKLLQTDVLTELVRSKLNVDRLMLRQQEGFVSVMPAGRNAFGAQFERVLPASSVANLYPFNYSGKTDPHGFYIGKDKYGANNDWNDFSESPPDDVPDKTVSAPAKAQMNWSDEYRLARRCLFGGKDQPQDLEQAFTLFQQEAQKGNALAMHDLGRMLADGLGRKIDMQAAHVWYSKALAAFYAVERQKKKRYAEYRIGKLYAAGLGCEQDYGDAARWFQLSADKGYKYAQYSLAGLFRRGQGVEQDDARALELYTASAQQDFPYAAYELGKMYRDGIGCEKDAEASEQWYRQAFAGFLELEQQSHDDKLQYRIGWMLLHGVGTGKDETAAREWFEQASKLDNPHAQYQLARMIFNDPSSTPEQTAQALERLTKAAEAGQDCAQYALGKIYRDGQGVEKDIQKAVALFTLAATKENSFAAFALGKLYLAGDAALPRDPAAALKWLTYAAELGNQFAQYRLGKLLLKGDDGIPKDVITAIRWLTAAAKQENGYAEYVLALVYLTGEDAPKDSVKALSLLKRSAGRGNQFAQYRLGKLLLQGEDAPKDVKAAIRWLTAAAEQGNQYAQYALGKLYLLGKEVPKDRSSAIKWFQLAADQGNEYAQYFLKHMDDRLGQPPVAAVISLFHHLANIFQEQNQPPPSGGVRVAVDRKLLRKIKAKKIAQGHKADDHEPEMQL